MPSAKGILAKGILMDEYWKECIEISFEEAGIKATKEQIEIVVSSVEGGHENYGMAHGYECIPNPLMEENKRKHYREKNKQLCSDCKGKGRIIIPGPYHSSDSQCYSCNGEGFIYLD